MPDLLTHVLLAYVGAVAVVRFSGVPDRLIPVAMVGATAPDVMKASILAGVAWGELLGVPYSTWSLHTLGGAVVLAGFGALTIRERDRRAAFGALAAGGLGHLFLDAFVIRVDGLAPPYLFPLTGWLPPAGNLYASSDVWPAVLALAVAVPVWLIRRTRRRADGAGR
ncbi:MAG: metal-dependent hydrolase [Salinirussus sp.]